MTRNIQQLPNNSGSTSIVEVATNTGFNAGDLVYFTNGDYKSSSGLINPSSVNFPITQNSPTANSTGVQSTIQPVFGATQFQNSINGGSTRKFAATLTNGNIVQVFFNQNTGSSNAYRPYFQIVSSTGAIVVNPTVVSTAYYASSWGSISVVALTGGGFAVIYINQSGGTTYAVNYAIYTNTGSVTTAIQQDTGASLSNSSSLEVVALANGGFAVSAVKTSGVTYLRAYGATGTAAYAWVNTGLPTPINAGQNGGYSQSYAIASRSDSSVFIACVPSTTTSIAYVLYNSSGTAIVSSTTFALSNPISTNSFAGPDASVLSDGTTIVIAYYDYSGGYQYPCFRFLPTGNTLGAQQTAIPQTNQNYLSSYSGNYISVLGLSAGGFALVFSDGYNTMQYAFFNSSGTCLSGTNANGAIPQLIYGGFLDRYLRVTLIESAGYLNLYWSNGITNSQPSNQFFVQINETTYQLVVPNYASTLATTLTNAPGSIASTRPSSLSYYSSSTTSTSVTNSISAVVSPSILTGSAQNGLSQCSLTNGGFVIAYATGGGAGTINVFNSTYSLVSTLGFTANSSTVFVSVKLAALSNGGFVLGYMSTTSTSIITLAFYSSTYSLVTTVNQALYGAFVVTGYTYDIAGLSNGGVVMAFTGSSTYCNYATWSNIGVPVVSATTANSVNAACISVATNAYGGFAISYFDNTNTYQRVTTLLPSSSTSFYAPQQYALSSYGGTTYPNSLITATPSGGWLCGGWNASAWTAQALTDSGYPQYTYYSNSIITQPFPGGASNSGWAVGYTGVGSMVMIAATSPTQAYLTSLPTGLVAFAGGAVPYTAQYPISSTSLTITSSFFQSTGSTQFRISPLSGNNCLIAWLDSNQYPRYAVYSCAPSLSTYTITSGVSVSAPVAINPNPNASSPSITGVLSGVASTTASAGSTGQVVINGLAQLNSNYSTSNTGAFDYTGNAVVGVKGTYNGRLVNLQGNT